MRLHNLHVLSCFILGSVILSESAKKNLEESLNKLHERKNGSSFLSKLVYEGNEKFEDRLNDDPDDPSKEDFPILPPLILLDFNNETIDSNTTSEEKSKRTVENGLGYGFNKNSLFSGKTNYYFPAGKTGTTVSIEESVSPFLPRTIIEKYIPNNFNSNEAIVFPNLRSSQTNDESNPKLHKITNYYDTYDSNYRTKNDKSQSSIPSTISTSTPRSQNLYDLKSSRYLLSNLNIPSYQRTTNINTHINGQRGNIFHPTVQTYLERGQNNILQQTIPTTQTTSQIDDSQIFRVDYTDHRLIQTNPNYTGLKQNHFRTTHHTSAQSQPVNYNNVPSKVYNDPRLTKTVSTTPNSLDTNSQNYRYYQNIFNNDPNQRYYNGQGQHYRITSQDSSLISNNPDLNNNRNNYQSYVEQRQNDQRTIYTTPSTEINYEYVQSPTTQSNRQRYTIENGVRYENKIFWKYPNGRISHEPPGTYVETTYTEDSTVRPEIANIQETYIETDPSTEYTINAQGPIQFPIAPKLPSKQNPFVSSESLSSNLSHQQAYRIGYQNLVSQRPNVAQLAQKAKMEYIASTESSFVTTTPFSSTGRQTFLSKKKQDRNNLSTTYTTTARPVSKYMVNGPNAEYIETTESTSKLKSAIQDNINKGNQQSNKNINDYNNLQYSDLLNYNPSISQYIKDPSSILNVRPTFVQAGNSLVPVIILRVDGVPPVQTKTTSNINLKALLQEYLIQYAKSIKELAQPTNYQLGVEQFSQTQRTIKAGNHLLQLARQTQNDNNDESSSSPSTFLSQSYSDPQNYEDNVYLSNDETRSIGKFGDRTNVRPKIKSVQIIDDQRFTN